MNKKSYDPNLTYNDQVLMAAEEFFGMPGYLRLPDGIDYSPLMVYLQGHSIGVHILPGQTIAGDRDVGEQAV